MMTQKQKEQCATCRHDYHTGCIAIKPEYHPDGDCAVYDPEARNEQERGTDNTDHLHTPEYLRAIDGYGEGH